MAITSIISRFSPSQMDSDAITVAQAVLDTMPLSSWWESRGIARATAFRLVKLARIEPGKMKVPTSRVPVSCLTAEQVAQLDALAAHLKNGKTLPLLEAMLTTSMVPAAGPAETVSDDPGPSPSPLDPGALLERLEAGERAIRSGLPLSTSEVAWLLQARPGGDRVQRAGVEAVRHGRNCWQLRRSDPV